MKALLLLLQHVFSCFLQQLIKTPPISYYINAPTMIISNINNTKIIAGPSPEQL